MFYSVKAREFQGKMKNIMSVDLEDYFCDLPFNEWPKYESRIVSTTDLLLELFDDHNTKSTFFTLGYIAEKFPKLIKKIHDRGHELSSHTYSHMDLRTVTPEEFEKDFLKSKNIIEKITGEKILGFRAPFFSVNKQNTWVFEILKRHIVYDSSVFPVKTPLYGIPNAPKTIYHPKFSDITKNDSTESFFEIPLLVYSLFPRIDIPAAGGFYFRFLPYFFTKKAIQSFNKNNIPIMFYIHPKDLDDNMPKISEYSWHYYFGKKNIKNKFKKLLNDFEFSSVKKILIKN